MITAMTFCFAASLYSYSSMLGELEIMKVACNFYGDGGFWSYLYQLNEILIGGAAPLECFKDADFTVLVVIIILYLLVSMVIMSARTFSHRLSSSLSLCLLL